MIKNWNYNHIGEKRPDVKNFISEKKYKTIDVGASAMYWSYPECGYVADSVLISKEGTTFFKLNLEDKSTWNELLSYVEINGKFDFSICSHTLEDVFNPLDLIGLLTKISNSGFIAIPSKYDEFSFLYQNNYRGNAHHKQFFDIVDDTLVVYPKFSWTERDERSNEILKYDKGRELSFYWENEIPVEIFGVGKPFMSDGDLMNEYYKQLVK
jgi:hypothetical protein